MGSIITNFAQKLANSYNYGYVIWQKIRIAFHHVFNRVNKCNSTKEYRNDLRQGAFSRRRGDRLCDRISERDILLLFNK